MKKTEVGYQIYDGAYPVSETVYTSLKTAREDACIDKGCCGHKIARVVTFRAYVNIPTRKSAKRQR